MRSLYVQRPHRSEAAASCTLRNRQGSDGMDEVAERPVRRVISFDEHIRLARVNALRKFGRWTDLAVLCAALLAAAAFWNQIDHTAMAGWLGCMLMISGVRVW